MPRICRRPAASGSGMRITTSNRPGLSMASSSSSSRLVMPTTSTLSSGRSPSILLSSWFTTESLTPEVSPESDPRLLMRASISSKQMTCSGRSRGLPPALRQRSSSSSAGRNSRRTLRSASPTHLSSSSGPLTNLGGRASRRAASSRAMSVFPHPGGPYRSRPRTWRMPARSRTTGGSVRLASTRLVISWSSSSSPPTSTDRSFIHSLEVSG
mmetsp:Transcript_20961/g.31605  ORF Transcript_20961/g.31605 Transcript_20961/m.31605 type:complete len:212 (+) Transcript_20961:2-637(+)